MSIKVLIVESRYYEDVSNLLLDASIEELTKQTIPESIRLEKSINLPDSLTESRFIEHIHLIGKKNKNYRFSCRKQRG